MTEFVPALSEQQVLALKWIHCQPHHKATWRASNKKSHPKYWDQMWLSGKAGSLMIPKDDWRVLWDNDFIEAAPWTNKKQMYVVTRRGLGYVYSKGEANAQVG